MFPLRHLAARSWRCGAAALLISLACTAQAHAQEKEKGRAEAKKKDLPAISESAKAVAQAAPSVTVAPPVIPEVPRDQIICFALYTTHKDTLKLSAFFYPLKEGEERKAVLEVRRDGAWLQVAEAPIEEMGWMSLFRVEKWDNTQDVAYRVKHASGAVYEGLVRRNPVDKDEIIVGSFSCNGNNDRGPRADIIANIKQQNPDLLFFSGRQCDEHEKHDDAASNEYDHYAAWLLFGRQFGEICRDRPVVTIPDDRDISQTYLWGEGGEISRSLPGTEGGYFMPVPYVNLVQRAQCSHLPDPADPMPVKNGITVYYTSLNVGGIDFAIIEDRKWKSSPYDLLPQLHVKGLGLTDAPSSTSYRQSLDVAEAELLGERQIKFLRGWEQEWAGVTMKCVLSQTPFSGIVHEIVRHNLDDPERLVVDVDDNGWPQSRRNEALRELRRAFAVHLCGHAQLGAVAQYGINQWGDAPYVFAAPALAGASVGLWRPLEKAPHLVMDNPLPDSGTYLDNLGNKITMEAYYNASRENGPGTGYAITRFKKGTREITFELWKRGADAAKDSPAKGWPVTIRQEANYGRAPVAWLPTLKITGAKDPVVEVVDEANGELVYALRIAGTQFRPKVFRPGTYTVQVGEGEHKATLSGVESIALNAAPKDQKTLEVIVP
jgi:hypothetical protein